jgi:preprotein translocase subunit SecB
MIDLKRIISVVQIESVRLCEAHYRSAVQPSEIADAIKITTSRKTEVVKEPTDDRSFRIETAFTMEVRSTDDDEKLQAEIRGTFELSYEIPDDDSFSSEELEAFGEVNAVFNAWPYWRELVQASLARMSMPPLTMPVFRLVPADTADEADDDDDE